MFEFHKDKKRYFEIQNLNCRDEVIPFINEKKAINKDFKILEVGCGEGGVLKPFLEMGCEAIGVELLEHKYRTAEKYLKEFLDKGQLKLINKNIYDKSFETEFENVFDVVVLKDVIEHIPNQSKILAQLKKFIKKDGVIYFGFPPWYMPFGGHQQVLKSKFLSRLPYFHILPAFICRLILKAFGEHIDDFMDIKLTGISIRRFEKIVKQNRMYVLSKIHFLINPIYHYKLGIKKRKQFSLISNMPVLKEFLTTGVFYLIGK